MIDIIITLMYHKINKQEDNKMAKSITNGAKKMVMKPCYRTQVVRSKKGKGSFKRNKKHKGSHDNVNHGSFFILLILMFY